jgi:hypothetical protein
MFEIDLSEIEKKRLLHYAESINEQAHWGDSDITIPEYRILFNAIKNTESNLQLSPIQLDILCNWIYEGTKGGRLLNTEDKIVIGKIYEPIQEYYKNLKGQYFSEISKLEENINLLNSILSKKPIKTIYEILLSKDQVKIEKPELDDKMNGKIVNNKLKAKTKSISIFNRLKGIINSKIKLKNNFKGADKNKTEKKDVEKKQMENVFNLANKVKNKAKILKK